jgi:putative nucleotidyltransferase with HDIG domain
MIKKVRASDVRLGMYIHEIKGNWLEHPFWRKSFKLEQQKDLDKLLDSKLTEIWIDTSKGLDVEETKRVDAVVNQVAAEPKRPVKKPVKTVSLEQELAVAKKLHSKTKAAVVSMFGDARMGKAIEVEEASVMVDEINQSVERNSNALLSLIRLKTATEYTYLHSVAVCILMIAVGKQLGLQGEELKQAGMAGLLHDIGKMEIPDEILDKPGKLTDEEFDIMKSHPQRGWELLKSCDGIHEAVLDVCLHHHERVDGKGYPEKLSGDVLTLFARMGAVCDVYDAISSDRCYKKAWSPAESIHKMASWREGHFNEKVFQAFVKTIGIYPNGTLVKLKSGRLGVVMEQSKKSLTAPIVKVFFSMKANAHLPAEIIDLSKGADSIEKPEDPVKWNFDLDRIQGV